MRWEHTADVMERKIRSLIHKFHDSEEPEPLTDTLIFVKGALNYARYQLVHLECDSDDAEEFAVKYRLSSDQEEVHDFFLGEIHRLTGLDYYTPGKPWYRYREGHEDPIEQSIFGHSVRP